MNKPIRRPRPHFTTALATKKAMTTSSTLELAKPENALTGEMVPVSTTAAIANMAAVRRGNAPTSTEAIAAMNTAKRCQAAGVSPAGTGVNQIAMTRAKGNSRRIKRLRLLFTDFPQLRARLLRRQETGRYGI